ncbi:hypothetical protein PMIN07_005495 [Paraphaeosphaeria minitans]
MISRRPATLRQLNPPMPPWVARQWHAWGCSRSVSGDLCRSQRFGGPRNLRLYAQSAVREGAKTPLGNINSAIIVPSSVANTRPEDLIAHIKPILRQRVFKDRFTVFFVTPSFATWLLKDHVFLQKALQRTYAHLLDRTETPYARIHALCAVVDKLPVSRPVGNIANIGDEVRQRIQDPTVQETGQEGIAYATLSSSDSLPTSSDVGLDKAAISFVTFKGSDDDGGHFSDIVRLPLANTVFQTGSPTTMTYSTWEKAKGSNELTLKEKRNISHHGIRMQVENETQSTVLSVPLVPLSKPRKVEASMGNILRRVTGPHGTSVTASLELEQQVPRYFSTRGEPSQTTTVWALVMGPDHNILHGSEETYFSLQGQSEEKQWENLWKQDPPCWSPLVPAALKQGARLHRVLSGGGGWGKKAGLLSLDPIPTRVFNFADGLSDPGEHLEEDFDEYFGEEGPDLDSALQQIARPGDWVQFFISPSVPAKDGIIAYSHGGEQVWGLELGTIPSTTDAMPVVLGETETAGRNEISVFKSTFGGLAEGGMVISRRFKLGQRDDFATVGTSTVDVPFSRFSVLKWRTDSSSEDDVDSFRDCHESRPSRYDLDLAKTLYGDSMPRILGLDNSISESLSEAVGTGPYTSREDEIATGLLATRQRPPKQSMATREQTQILAAHPSPGPQQISERTTAIRKIPHDIGRLEQTAKVPVPEQPLIRFYKLDTPPRDELAYCTDSLRRVDRKVARYVKIHRELINQIRRQNGLRTGLAVRQPKPKMKPLPLTFLPLVLKTLSDSVEEVEDPTYQYHKATAAVRRNRDDEPFLFRKVATDIPRGFVSWLESATNESAHWIGMYAKDFENVMATIRMNRIYRNGLEDTILVPRGAPGGVGGKSYNTGTLRLMNVRLTPRRLIAGLSETTRQIQVIIDSLQDRIDLTPQRLIIAVLANKIFGITALLAKSINETLTVISLRANMALAANNSAVAVYGLHMRLRWQLTSIIMSRRGRKYCGQRQGRALRMLAKITRKYAQLCSFDKNLFFGSDNLTGVMHKLLRVKEMENRLSRLKIIREGRYVSTSTIAGKMKGAETKVRKMDAQHKAIKALENVVKGWLG